MNLNQIEKKLKSIVERSDQSTFVFEFLSAYGLPKASITRLEKGTYNLSRKDGEVLWKKRLFFSSGGGRDLLNSRG